MFSCQRVLIPLRLSKTCLPCLIKEKLDETFIYNCECSYVVGLLCFSLQKNVFWFFFFVFCVFFVFCFGEVLLFFFFLSVNILF